MMMWKDIVHRRDGDSQRSFGSQQQSQQAHYDGLSTFFFFVLLFIFSISPIILAKIRLAHSAGLHAHPSHPRLTPPSLRPRPNHSLRAILGKGRHRQGEMVHWPALSLHRVVVGGGSTGLQLRGHGELLVAAGGVVVAATVVALVVGLVLGLERRKLLVEDVAEDAGLGGRVGLFPRLAGGFQLADGGDALGLGWLVNGHDRSVGRSVGWGFVKNNCCFFFTGKREQGNPVLGV